MLFLLHEYNDAQLMMENIYMYRCLELAKLGAGNTAPNPMVGAVLVHNGRIIGEGYHQKYGEAHAEVNCLNSVREEDRSLIPQSVLYVSLEPCAHFGKTPPCADLIIRHAIPEVIIGCRDPFKAVDGKGIEKLKAAGIKVTVDILKKECQELNKRFFTFYTQHRPYVLLKWAQTSDCKIGKADGSRIYITHPYTDRRVHKWRSEEAAIMVGTTTALLDDPQLTTRYWQGVNPVRLVLDMDLRLPASLHVFDGTAKTVVFNKHRQEDNPMLSYCRICKDGMIVQQILDKLYEMNILSVMIEGGARLLQSFIDEGAWDEARVITNTKLYAGTGVSAPGLHNAVLVDTQAIETDLIQFFTKQFSGRNNDNE